MKVFTYLCLASLLLVTCACYGLPKAAVPRAVGGVIDLRQHNLSQKTQLNGQWQFNWHRFINPGASDAHDALVDFPFMWKGYILHGRELPGFGYATYRLTVLLPKTSEQLRIVMPEVYSAYKLYINGKIASFNGQVSTSEKGFIPYWEGKSIDIDPNTDTLRLVLQIANFAHSQGGIKKSILIGTKEKLELAIKRAQAIDLVLTGCLFMGGMFFLGLYLLGNRDKATLLFAIFSMIYSYRLVGIDNYVLHAIFPGMSWYITTRLEYITLFAGIGLFGIYTRYLYPKDVNKTIVSFLGTIFFMFAAAALILPPRYFTQLINPFLIATLYCLVYVPYVYTKAYKKKRPGALFALLSTLALMLVFAISLMHYWDVAPPLQLLSFAGYIGFFFLQSLVLSHRVSFVLKKARQQAEQGLKAKSEFLSTMSHEIRTPLNSVIGMSHLLLKNNPRPDQVKDLDVMLFSANNLLAIVNDILDYNKIEAGKITFELVEMDLQSMAGNIVNGLNNSAHDKNIALHLKVDPALQNKIIGDPTRTIQVITNLVHNAIKFTQAGYVELCIEVKEQTSSTITIHIQVKDTGIGISKKNQKLIFDRFTQADSSISRSFGGTGLGLAICKRILELQGSSLNLISKEGEGSTFYFTQTFDKSIKTTHQQEQTNDIPPEENKPLTGVAILLVEDNPMNVLVAQKFLQRWGAQIDVAVNGQEALDKLDLTRHKLVLMDLHMPVMDGFQASKKMRKNGVTIPIIALTANLPKEIENEVRLTGINDMVIKPFLPDELYRKVLHHLFKTT